MSNLNAHSVNQYIVVPEIHFTLDQSSELFIEEKFHYFWEITH